MTYKQTTTGDTIEIPIIRIGFQLKTFTNEHLFIMLFVDIFYPTLTEHQYLCAVYCPVKHLLACYVEIEDEDGLLLRTFDNELRMDG